MKSFSAHGLKEHGFQLLISASFCISVMFQKGFVEAQTDDGVLEVFGLKQGWHTSFVMVELITAKHLAQVLQLADISFECEVLTTLIYGQMKGFMVIFLRGTCKL